MILCDIYRCVGGKKDEPQHLLQGALTPTMLENMAVPYEILPDYAEGHL